MNMRQILMAGGIAFAASITLASPVSAQYIVGSGVVPAQKANSPERPIGFAAIAPEQGTLVIITPNADLPNLSGVTLSQADRAAIQRALSDASFDGAQSTTLSLRGIGPYGQILIIGLGTGRTPLDWQLAGGVAARELASDPQPLIITGGTDEYASSAIATGFGLGQYRFDRYRTEASKPVPTAPVTIIGPNNTSTKALFDARGMALIDGARLARDLSNEPANVIYPESFAARTREAFAGVAGVTVELLDEAAMRKLGMGAIVGVGQGSPRGSRLIAVRYRGQGAPAAPLALVGKGITFDSGGLSLKPGNGMTSMKGDMAGAASVMGAALSLAKSRAPVHIVAVAALAENMPSGNAQRPSDVVRTLSGKTIEMTNADAEGRLVLADANEYVARQYQPRTIVNIATLTGAVVSAVGNQYAGLFARSDATADQLAQAGITSGEKLWRLPLDKAYADYLRSDVADISNSSASGGPGATLGALFIDHFVDAKIDWAHLDIAGVFRSDKAGPLTPKGMTGYGVRLLDEFSRNAK
jgi:leucyl aminopeptidase